jgi:N-acetylgalactosamine-6-sulfatase
MESNTIVFNRRQFLNAVGAAAVSTLPVRAFAGKNTTRGRKPNFVFIFADDLGWGDLGCYGNRQIKTPNLDELAKKGTLFTQFYVSGSVCSPSRTSIMTSHFPARHGVHGHFATHKQNKARAMPNWLDPKVHTVTQLLKDDVMASMNTAPEHLRARRSRAQTIHISGPGPPPKSSTKPFSLSKATATNLSM